MVRAVRLVGRVEGLSWLLLLFVAMPLKYGFGQPWAVSWVGLAHGVLFTLFVVVLGGAHLQLRWPLRKSTLLFVSALVPFGFLWMERELDADEGAPRSASSPSSTT
jgi:integral membrane protein